MFVSAVIPCYNAQSTIGRAIDSLLHQSIAVDEIIVVNDGSVDNSLQVLQDIAKGNEKIKILTQENKGVSNARNVAINEARGKFILTLDADDYFESTFLEKAILKFAEDENYGAVMCGYVRIIDNKKVLPYIPSEISLKSCLFNNGALSCLLFKKKAIIEAGGYDEKMVKGYEDWDLNIRILKAGFTFGIVREVLFNYVDTAGSRTYTATSNDMELRIYMYYKYKELYKKNASYIYHQLISQNIQLRRRQKKFMQSISFKLGDKIIGSLRVVKHILNFKRQ
ncbi:glycosyltransferase family 2 protein [Dokdonia sp. R86516]|uniref:glycosyltransferase family 2 protein n=1 Tax=Dokdonia sp. R86516 TaxID=3093856 RepID=UPI0037C699D0